MEVLSQGNFESFNFSNNVMLDGNGFWVEGDLDFMAIKNDFLGSIYGSFFWFTGDSQENNEIRDNYFFDNLDGNVAVDNYNLSINDKSDLYTRDLEFVNVGSLRILKSIKLYLNHIFYELFSSA